MTSDPVSPLPDVEPAGRAEELLQRFFDGTLTEDESASLLDIWDRFPQIETIARENHATDRSFRFITDAQQVLSPAALEAMTSKMRRRLGLADREGTDAAFSSDEERFFAAGMPDLGELVRLADESPSLPKPTPPTTTSELDEAGPFQTKARPKSPDVPEKPRRFLWLVVTIAVLFTVAIYHEFHSARLESSSEFVVLGRVTETIDAVWEEGAERYKAGQDIEPNRLKLKSGIVKIRFANGAELLLEGPSELLVKSESKTFCQSGKISAYVPPAAIGFQVDTPLTSVVDLGTAFSVLVDENRSEVHVVEGKVETRRASQPPLQLARGEAFSVDVRGREARIPALEEMFFSAAKFLERKKEYVEKRETIRDAYLRKLSSDPALLYSLDAAQTSAARRVNADRGERTALRFDGPASRQNVSLHKTSASLTLIAYVRLLGMRHVSNTLLMSDDFYEGRGRILWQLDRSGILQFHVNTGRDNRFKRFDTGQVIDRKDWNTWLMLAVVADAKNRTVTHYVDGRPVATLPWDEPIPLETGALTLGNEPPIQRRQGVRYFNGDIEEFRIFGRPFSEREIRGFYQAVE